VSRKFRLLADIIMWSILSDNLKKRLECLRCNIGRNKNGDNAPFFCFIGNFVPIKQKELNARAKFSANSGNAHGRNKALCFFLPLCISSKYTMILWSGCGEAALFYFNCFVLFQTDFDRADNKSPFEAVVPDDFPAQ